LIFALRSDVTLARRVHAAITEALAVAESDAAAAVAKAASPGTSAPIDEIVRDLTKLLETPRVFA